MAAIRQVSSPYLPSLRGRSLVDETVKIGYDDPTLITTKRETVKPKEKSFWASLGEVAFGWDVDNSFYEENVARVKKLDDINEITEREKALKENASWMLLKSKEVVGVVAQNIKAGRDPYRGLNYDMGIPMSPEQLVHTDGYSPEEQYHYNLLAYFLSKAVLENAKILASYDMDGTLTDKSLSPFATRRMQPISQIHQNRVSLDAGIEHLNMEVMINTARSLVQTIILANLEGPESKFTYAPHTEATEELVGFLLSDQCKILESINIAAANGGVESIKDGETYISDALVKSNRLLKKLGPSFVETVFKKPAEMHENSDNEFKGLNRFMFDNKHVIGKVSFQHFKKIMQYWQEEVVGGQGKLPDKLNNFRERVLNGKRNGKIDEEDKQYAVNEGARKLTDLEKIELRKEGINFNPKDDIRVVTSLEMKIQAKGKELERLEQQLEDLIIDKTDVKELSQSDRQRELLLREKIEKVEKELEEKKTQCNRFIRLIGSSLDNKSTAKNWGLVDEKEAANHYELLKSDPEAYVRYITHGDPFGFCTHFFNSRGTPYEKAIQEVIDNLRSYQYDISTRRDIREINYEFYVNSKSGNAEVNDEIDKFVEDGKKKYGNGNPKDAIEYINWRLSKHVMFNYTKDELKNCKLFKIGDELTLRDEVKSEWQEKWKQISLSGSGQSKHEALYYRDWLQSKFKSQLGDLPPGIGEYLASYLEDILPENYLAQEEETNISVPESYFMPDEMYARKGKNQYTGKDTLLAIFRLDEKSDPLRPEGQFYYELLPLRAKNNVIPSFRKFFLKRLTGISSGDTASDLPPHAAMIMRRGIARIIYSIINEGDVCEEIIRQQEKLVDAISISKDGEEKQAALKELYIANKHFGIYGLEKNKDGTYSKVSVIRTGKEFRQEKSGRFSNEELLQEARELCLGRIDKNRSPGHLICKTADLTELLTGRRCKLDKEKFKLALGIHEKIKKGINISKEEQIIYDTYKSEIIELENSSKLSIDAPRFRVFHEYTDKANGNTYYRFKSDGKLYTKEGKLFEGDEKKLEQKVIKEDIHGVFIYEDNGKPFNDPRLLNKLLVLENPLPSPSSASGPFASKKFLKFLGLGNEKKGTQRLETFLTKLPKMFSHFLELCGGLMALGGVARLVSIPFANDEENSVAKAGYWTSNTARACSAFGASLRGILNVNRLWDVTAGEVINMFSALFLGNGAKHVGFAVGNIFLFTGRGLQAAQRAQRVNAPTEKEVKEKKLDEHTIDPRPHVRNVVRFSLEGIVLPIKHAFQKAGMSGTVGEIFGRLASSVVTPIKMTKDIITNPKLVTQIKNRISEKNGALTRLVPSNGHLLALTGVLSGIGAIFAGTFGRMERVGEIAEHGFNSIGRWGVSLATSVAALGIISNGFEVAANTQGLPKIFRGLDGQDVKYSPKRAGLGQVIAGIGYAVVPLFGLHKDWVASLFDVTTGLYFGLPGTRSSVAQEEIPNSFNLAKSVLIEGQRFYTDGEINIDIDADYEKRAKKYVYKESTKKFEYDPNFTMAV